MSAWCMINLTKHSAGANTNRASDSKLDSSVHQFRTYVQRGLFLDIAHFHRDCPSAYEITKFITSGMWRWDWAKKLWRRTLISCLAGHRHTNPSIARSRIDKRQSTSHRSHLTLDARRPTCWSHCMRMALSLNNKLKRLNGLLRSDNVMSGMSSRAILVAHGERWSTNRLILLRNAIRHWKYGLTVHVDCHERRLIYYSTYLCRRSRNLLHFSTADHKL